jgi:hypothetical protein
MGELAFDSSNQKLFEPFCRGFSVGAQNCWNKLPKTLKSGSFKTFLGSSEI